MIPTVRLYLDTRRIPADAPAPLKIVITKNKIRSLISLGVSVLREQWNPQKQEVFGHPRKHQLNSLLQERKVEVLDILHRLRSSVSFDSLSVTEIKNLVVAEMSPIENAGPAPLLFVDHYKKFMGRKTGGTHDLYQRTLKRIKAFDSDWDSLTFEDISVSWLREFDAFLAKTSTARNARNIHLRNIRAVFNDAINEELITCYPFRKFKIVGEETRKRSLSVEQLRSLFNAELSGADRRYMDCFKIIFMLCGINIVDLCHLPPLVNGYAEYRRAKTHRLYSIKAEPEVVALIEKYKGEGYALNYVDNCKDYRFFYRHLAAFLRKYGEDHGLPGLSSYWARHSWATIAASLDIPKETIAAALGHGGRSVTDIYIDFDRKKIDEANRKVLDWVLYGKK